MKKWITLVAIMPILCFAATDTPQFVSYEAFGAKGDGKTNDFAAIVAAHEYANANNLPVRANNRAEYYIGGNDMTAQIKTDTDFGTARFIIDDTYVERCTAHVFAVVSEHERFTPEGVTTLKKGQSQLGISLPSPCLITVKNANVKRYIRSGVDANSGTAQTDLFIADRDGNIDMNGPIIWDFDQITEISALPMDEKILTISGGRFTTIANREKGRHKYYHRGINISRSNVLVTGLEHLVIEPDSDQSYPYSGFIDITDCANVTVKDTVFTGRKQYFYTPEAAGKPSSTGTYDIIAGRALNISFINCTQSNSILDRSYWGIMGSNFYKNLLFDGCSLSRFDAHMGVANATIRNSTLGHQGINAIGSGTLTLENSIGNGWSLINLRSDYGSTWNGKIIIRNCVFNPLGGARRSSAVIVGGNSGHHNFGYTCYMPETIEIDGLLIKDGDHPEKYDGPALLGDFNRAYNTPEYKERFPYIKTREIIVRNIATESGKNWRLSDNSVMFRDTTARSID